MVEPDTPPRTVDAPREPRILGGVRVLDLSHGVAGPYLTKLLGDLGADVVKVEPPTGDRTRRRGPLIGPADLEHSATFLHLNTNKRSVLLDLEDPDDMASAVRLAARSHLVVESFSPSEAERYRLRPEDLRALREDVVVVSVSTFGRTGPYAGYAGSDLLAYAVGGPLSSAGLLERPPLHLGNDLIDIQCGNVGAVAAMGALMSAEASGVSVHVDLAGVDTQVGSIDRRAAFLLYRAFTGRDAPRSGARPISVYPTGVYPTEDGNVVIATMPRWIPRMLATLDDPDLSARYADPGFADDPDLAEAADTAILTWTLQRTSREAMTAAQANSWPVTAVQTPQEVLADPHFIARSFWVDARHPAAGELRQPGAPVRIGRGGWKLERAAPTLGAHSDEVLAELAEPGPEPERAGRPENAESPRRGGRGRLPLAGVRILDLTVVWAGPFAAELLGDLGAEIIRVENPNVFPTNSRGHFPRPTRDAVAAMGPIQGGYPEMDPGTRPWNRSSVFACHGRNKKSVTLDLTRPGGLDTFLRLVERSDVLLENNRVELLDRLGISWERLRERNPRLILTRMPSVGLTGPYSDYLGFGSNFEALCGLATVRGYEDLDIGENDAVYHMDAATGATAAFATLAAIRRRGSTGAGEMIELAQAENLLNHIGGLLIEAASTGTTSGTTGNRHPDHAPRGVYRCADAKPGTGGSDRPGAAGVDRWIAIDVHSDAEWVALRRAMGDPDWASDGRFAITSGRVDHHDEIDAHISDWTTKQSHIELFHHCQAHGVRAGAVLTETECYEDPHLRARGLFRLNGNDDIGTYEFPGHLWRWTGPDMAWGRIPPLGADNEEIYLGLLEMTSDEYDELDRNGHISADFRGPDGQPY